MKFLTYYVLLLLICILLIMFNNSAYAVTHRIHHVISVLHGSNPSVGSGGVGTTKPTPAGNGLSHSLTHNPGGRTVGTTNPPIIKPATTTKPINHILSHVNNNLGGIKVRSIKMYTIKTMAKSTQPNKGLLHGLSHSSGSVIGGPMYTINPKTRTTPKPPTNGNGHHNHLHSVHFNNQHTSISNTKISGKHSILPQNKVKNKITSEKAKQNLLPPNQKLLLDVFSKPTYDPTTYNKNNFMSYEEKIQNRPYIFNNDLTNSVWDNIVLNDAHGFYNILDPKNDFCFFCVNVDMNYIKSKTNGEFIYVNPYIGAKYYLDNHNDISLFLSNPIVKFRDNIHKQTTVISGILYNHNISNYGLHADLGYVYQQSKYDNTEDFHYDNSHENGILFSTKINRKSPKSDMGLIISNQIFFGKSYTDDKYGLQEDNTVNNISELSGYLSLKQTYNVYKIKITPKIILSTKIDYNYNNTSMNYQINDLDSYQKKIIKHGYFDINGGLTTSVNMKIKTFSLHLSLGFSRSRYTKNFSGHVSVVF